MRRLSAHSETSIVVIRSGIALRNIFATLLVISAISASVNNSDKRSPQRDGYRLEAVVYFTLERKLYFFIIGH